MPIPVFLSYPQSHLRVQSEFITKLAGYLRERGFEPRTLGVTEYDMDAPLTAIRRLMLESNGMICVALRRLWIEKGTRKYSADVPWAEESDASGSWLTSPYCHIEPAMAFQLGLPILILREKGVMADGLLERGVVGTYMPEFSLESGMAEYLESGEWKALIGKWECQVRAVVESKGRPPQMY